MKQKEILALWGGEQAIHHADKDMFDWPILTKEDEAAVLDVLRRKAMSGIDVTTKFEEEFAAWLQVKYALGFNNGTASILAAMYGCGAGVGDEIIAPSMTYWASAVPAFSLGATIVFADIDPMTLCIDPKDIEHRITERTKAIVAVHYASYPAEMDPIMEIAARHDLKVIEDVSHAQGGTYKGRRLGTIGHAGAMSLMTGKAFAIGEAGMLVTNDLPIYERACAFCHKERPVQNEELKRYSGLALGGYKHRMHQMSSAVGRVQLKYYDQRVAEIDRAMTYFWDQLEGVPGVRAHRVVKEAGYRSGGWYYPRGIYVPEELQGLSITRFAEALKAEGMNVSPGCNLPLHTHPLFNEIDIYGHGKPTRIAHSDRDLRQGPGSLPVAENIGARVFGIPWFKHFRTDIIDQYVDAFKKVIGHHAELLEGDPGNPERIGNWSTFVLGRSDRE